MYVAWRDLRHARGRFLLIGAVVALITVLVAFLAGLTGGLAAQNVSAVLALPGDRLVLDDPAEGPPSFADSALDPATVRAWQAADGVRSVLPVGLTQGRAASRDGTAAVALVGVAPRPTTGEAHRSPVTDIAPTRADGVGLSSGAAEALGVDVGDRVTIAGSDYAVTEVGADLWYSHTPVVVLAPTAWGKVDRLAGGTGEATVLAVTGAPAWGRLATRTGTTQATKLRSLTALGAFRSEIGSLGVMILMLFGVSALVVGAFFTVWTMQRAGDVAVLKALGASTGSLVRDALGQALLVLVVGIGTGLVAVVALGALVGDALPFLLSPVTTLVPAAAMTALGLLGAAVSLRTVTRTDPLTALGGTR